MPINFHLPTSLQNAGWKIKIREKETLEPPHITILHGTQAWRINLRTGEFMDKQPDPDDVPEGVTAFIQKQSNWQLFHKKWDKKYPMNPVRDKDADEAE